MSQLYALFQNKKKEILIKNFGRIMIWEAVAPDETKKFEILSWIKFN